MGCMIRHASAQEATVVRMVERILGTLIGATLAYLIMLHADVYTRGSAVLPLDAACLFVFAQAAYSQAQISHF